MLRVISTIVLLLFFFSTTAAPVLAAINYSYDANGNMASDGAKCYEHNEANQLKKVKRCSDNQIIAEYVYDYNGKRLVKKEYRNGVLKQTVFSPSDEYETKKKSYGTTQNTTYYKVNDEMVAKKNPDGSINYYHNDHLGSNSVITDQNGNVVEKTTYEPYGEVKQGGTKSKFGYTGQEKDLETGLNYYDARYYDSHIQRFIQPDTMLPDVYDPQQLNRYSYARNNPLKYTDPSGNNLALVWGAIVTAVIRAVQPVQNLITKITAKPSANQNLQKGGEKISDSGKKLNQNTNQVKPQQNPIQTGNKVSSNNSSINTQNNPLQKGSPGVPPKALDIAQKLKESGGKKIDGYVSKIYHNKTEPLLPEGGKYIEHDIKPLISNLERGLERVVMDINTGKTWYTPDHYKTWIPIK
jgi:RHS repeat-associated protein